MKPVHLERECTGLVFAAVIRVVAKQHFYFCSRQCADPTCLLALSAAAEEIHSYCELVRLHETQHLPKPV